MTRTPSKPRTKPSKPHIPHRGDDPSVGKKTGIKVPRIQRATDGYESFNDVLSQALTPPPRPKKNRISDGEEKDENEDDDDDKYGEASMDVDSPVSYSTTPRAATSTRPVARGFLVAVPSPRAGKFIRRAGPSRLGTREQDESEDDEGMNYDQQDGLIGQEEEEEPVKSPKSKGKGTSSAPTSKGRGRALSRVREEEEDEMEDDMAQGMQDIDQGGSEEEEEERAPPKKRIKGTPAPTKPRAVSTRQLQKENRDVSPGVRRSQRIRYLPLEYWRGEKRVYCPREPGQPRQVPHIKEIIRIPQEPLLIRRGASKRKRGRSRATEHTPEIIEREVIVEVNASNPEDGWDDDTAVAAVVLDYRTGKPVTRRVAFTAKMFDPAPANAKDPDDVWSFQKIFEDADFMAAGQLVIPVGKRKPSKGTKDNTYIFYVVQGAVSVVVCKTCVVLATGGMFTVPRGNTYLIENIGDRDAKLFFAQAREVREGDEEGSSSGPQPRTGCRSRWTPRVQAL
ncbi:Mif2/CENP-C like-domain-containing protein [Mycena haematopus]|nr:Mif2/CENP-C like-domain-containing protein [Mycena haematopus]